MTVDEALQRAERVAATLNYLSDVRCEPYAAPSRAALDGLADLAGQIKSLISAARRALPESARQERVDR